MYAFTYHRPKSLREAASLLAKNEEAKYLGRRALAVAGDEAAPRGAAGPDRPRRHPGDERHRAQPRAR